MSKATTVVAALVRTLPSSSSCILLLLLQHSSLLTHVRYKGVQYLEVKLWVLTNWNSLSRISSLSFPVYLVLSEATAIKKRKLITTVMCRPCIVYCYGSYVCEICMT